MLQELSIQEQIIQLEEGLNQFKIDFLINSNVKVLKDTIHFIKPNTEKYNEINQWLGTYKHCPYIICSWTGKKISDPVAQLVNRIQHFNKYNCDNDLDNLEDLD